MIQKYFGEHIDLIEVISVGTGGLVTMFMDIELILKVCIGCASLGYILWKWRNDYNKSKK